MLFDSNTFVIILICIIPSYYIYKYMNTIIRCYCISTLNLYDKRKMKTNKLLKNEADFIYYSITLLPISILIREYYNTTWYIIILSIYGTMLAFVLRSVISSLIIIRNHMVEVSNCVKNSTDSLVYDSFFNKNKIKNNTNILKFYRVHFGGVIFSFFIIYGLDNIVNNININIFIILLFCYSISIIFDFIIYPIALFIFIILTIIFLFILTIIFVIYKIKEYIFNIF